jgi:hypothetical protein
VPIGPSSLTHRRDSPHEPRRLGSRRGSCRGAEARGVCASITRGGARRAESSGRSRG